MYNEDDDFYVNPGVSTDLDFDTEFVGDAVRVRSPSVSEENAAKAVARSKALPSLKRGKQHYARYYTPDQVFRLDAGNTAKQIRAEFRREVAAINEAARQQFATFSAETQKAYESGAITQEEAKRLISLKKNELEAARRVSVDKARNDAQARTRTAVAQSKQRVSQMVSQKQAAKEDAKLRSLERSKRQTEMLAKQGQMPADAAAAEIGAINAEIAAIAKGKGQSVANPKMVALHHGIMALRHKVQAMQAAIAQAESVGANYVTFGEIQVDLTAAKDRLAGMERQLSDLQAKLAANAPKKAVSRKFAPIHHDGSPVSPEQLRMQLKYEISRGNINQAEKIRYILNNMDATNGKPIKLRIYTVAVRESLPTGEKFAVTQSGSAKTQLQPIPATIPSAIPYETHKEE